MPREANDTAIIRPDLGVVVDEYLAARSFGMIAPQVLPYFPVGMQAGGFPVIPKEVLLKHKDTRRAPRAAYPQADWTWENGVYSTGENGYEEYIDEREKNMYRSMFDVEAVASRRAMKIVLTSREKRVADLVFSTTRFTGHAVSNKWSSYSDATPIEDVSDAVSAVELQCGMTPNALIIDSTTLRHLKLCDQIVERVKYTFPGIDIANMNAAQIAQALGVENLLVGGGVYDSAAQGKDASLARFWPSTQAMLTIIGQENDITEPCLGKTFYFTEESGDGEAKTVVETYRNESRRSDVVRVRHDSDERLLASYDDSGSVQSDIAAAVSYRMTNIQ